MSSDAIDVIHATAVPPLLRTALLAVAVIFVPFGLISFIAPAAVGEFYGGSTDAHGLLWARYYAAATVTIGLIAWFARRSGSLETLRFVTLGLVVVYGGNLAVSLYGAGILNAMHWTTIAMQAFFLAVFAYYRLALGRLDR